MPAWDEAPLVSPMGNTYGSDSGTAVGGALAPRKKAAAGTAEQRPTEAMGRMSFLSAAMYDLDELEALLRKNGPPKYKDAMLESYAGPTGALGPLAASQQDPRSVHYYATAGRLVDSLEKASTGAASSQQEAWRYIKSNIPAFYDDAETQISKITAMRIRMNTLDALSRGTIPERGEAAPTPAPTGRMGPPQSAPAPQAPAAPQQAVQPPANRSIDDLLQKYR